MSLPQPVPPKRERRWLQYSVRSLLVLTLLAAIGLGWVRHEMNRLQAEEEAVAAIRALGGTVLYETNPFTDEPPGPGWLRWVLGENFFREVEQVRFPAGVDDDAVRHLDRLRGLSDLDLRGARVTNAGLEPVWRKRGLIKLDLGSTALTDDDSPRLAGLRQLKALHLSNTAITDRSVRTLTSLSKLASLNLFGTHVTPEGVRQLRSALPSLESNLAWTPAPPEWQRQIAAGLEQWGAGVDAAWNDDETERPTKRAVYSVSFDDEWQGGPQQIDQVRALGAVQILGVYSTTLNTDSWERLTRPSARYEHNQPPGAAEEGGPGLAALRYLFLRDSAIQDADLKYICRWSHLEALSIQSAPITDGGLAHVARLTSLEELRLRSCGSITGSGLAHLRGLTRLVVLDLSGTNVADAALAHVGALGSLVHLDLKDTPVTDAGLRHLASLGHLMVLDLTGTQVAAAAVAAFQGAFSQRDFPLTIRRPDGTLSRESGAEDASADAEHASDHQKPQEPPR